MNFVASLLAGLGNMFAGASSQACIGWFWDEPECPKSLIK